MFSFNKRLNDADLMMLQKLHGMYSRSTEEFNRQLAPGDLPVELEALEQKGRSGRFFVRSGTKALSVHGREGAISVYLLLVEDLKLIPSSELASRLKYSLQRGEGDEWLLHGVPTNEEALRMLVLSTVDSLSSGRNKSFEPKHLRIEETSLTSAVKNLFLERYRLSAELIGQQERIFSNVARDLHDTVIGEMMILLRSLSAGEQKSNAELVSQLELIVQKLRDISADLSSREIRDWGLDEALRQLCQRHAHNKAIALVSDIPKDIPVFPYEISLQLYRIIQESITNALKHSRCSKISVAVKVDGPQLLVIVEDNGIGIAAGARNNLRKVGGTGLSILKERVELIRGHGIACSIVISDLNGKGSKIQLAMDLRSNSGI